MRMGMELAPSFDLEQLQLRKCPHCGTEVSVGNLVSDEITSEPICGRCYGQLYNNEQEKRS